MDHLFMGDTIIDILLMVGPKNTAGPLTYGIILPVVLSRANGIVQIMHAEYERPDYNEMLSLVYGLVRKYDVDKMYIDGANPSFIKSIKLQIGEVHRL
jgi:hypothetical protein